MGRFGRSILDTERVSMTDKMFGILCAGSAEEETLIVSTIIGNLIAAGCIEQNLKIRKVPSTENIPLGVLFFAEYTDVDAVIVLSFGERVPEYIRKSVVDLQIQWNMPTIFGTITNYRTVHEEAMDMISLQEIMEIESDEMANPDRRSIN